MRWDAAGEVSGTLGLGDGRRRALVVRAVGAGARLAFRDGALEVRRDEPAPPPGDATIELVVEHPLGTTPGDSVRVWVPHLTPEPGQVIADAVFRAPAILVADDRLAVALIADLDDVRAAVGTHRSWLDYDHPARTVTLAAGAWEPEGHVFYRRAPASFGRTNLRLHVLASEEPDDVANPWGMAARFFWERWGRPAHRAKGPPSLAALMDHVVRWAFESGWSESVWQEIGSGPEPRPAAPVFIVDVGRHPSVPRDERTWREPRSVWNQAWFSTQRCANGLLRYARQIGSPALERRARQMTEVALAAPEDDGLFPSVLLAVETDVPAASAAVTRWVWTNSDRRPRTVSGDAFHLVDAAFTARMLLDWHALTGEPRALARADRLADRLLRLQRPSGAFPGWIEPDGRIAGDLVEGPESAVSTSLLFEMALGNGRTDLLEPALAGARFLEGVAGDGRWEDFETYWSCAPWGQDDAIGRRIPRNGVFKQNTLSIGWSAEAFLLAHRATKQADWLDLARRTLSELSLYQAVWDPPWLPAPALGGFGVMNADCEWNDARQSLFAPLYLELGRSSGDPELVERGIAAIRASFTMMYCPENPELSTAYEARFPFFGPESYGFMMENQGHDPRQPIGTFTIFSWGNGSALAAAAMVADRFPEVAAACGLLARKGATE